MEGNRENKATIATQLKTAIDKLAASVTELCVGLPGPKKGQALKEAQTLRDLSTQIKIVISLRLGSAGDTATQLATLSERLLAASQQVITTLEGK